MNTKMEDVIDSDYLEMNDNIYLKKSLVKSTRVIKKNVQFDENNARKFKPDLVTIKILKRMLEKNTLTFFSNKLRHCFNIKLLEQTNNIYITMNELFKETFIFLNKYKGSECNKKIQVNERTNKNSVYVQFKSLEEITSIMSSLRKKFNI